LPKPSPLHPHLPSCTRTLDTACAWFNSSCSPCYGACTAQRFCLRNSSTLPVAEDPLPYGVMEA
jgi:hypothetical protein